MAFTIEWKGDDFVKRAIPAAELGLEKAADYLCEKARRSLGRNHGGVPSMPFGPPNSQTGNLRTRTVWVNSKVMGTLRAAFGTDVKYGYYLEKGAHVTSKSKCLTIPVTKEAKEALKNAKTVRAIPGLKYRPPLHKAPFFRGTLGKVNGKGKARKYEVWFVLRTDVWILERPWLQPAAEKGFAEAKRRFNATVADEMRKGAA